MAETTFASKVHETHIAYIHETWGQSFARDLTTVMTFIAFWSFGYFVGSAALEWVGVLLGGLLFVMRVTALLKRTTDSRMTPDEARAWLDKNFPQEAK
jgi:hypothetical protein